MSDDNNSDSEYRFRPSADQEQNINLRRRVRAAVDISVQDDDSLDETFRSVGEFPTDTSSSSSPRNIESEEDRELTLAIQNLSIDDTVVTRPARLEMAEHEFITSNFHKSIPEFSGNVRNLQHFITCCDLFYDNLDEENKPRFFPALVRKLTQKAFTLYHNRTWDDWNQFKVALKKYFSVHKSFETFQLELANIQQRNFNIRDYSQKVETILHEMNSIGKEIKIEGQAGGEAYFKVQNEKLALKAFINGLNVPIKHILKARKYETLDDAI